MKNRLDKEDSIVVLGAQEHNLKNVDVRLKRHALTVFTGVSGSGKSSLAFDTLFKEGQRRFLESLSAYARQFLGQMEKPAVDHIGGLSPAVAIDQKTVNRNPRSTLGTVTELYDYFRLLFARLGQPHCPNCGSLVLPSSPEKIAQSLLEKLETEEKGGLSLFLAPMVRERKGEYRKELSKWLEMGFVRARIDGKLCRLDEPLQLARYEKHSIDLVVDRFQLKGKEDSSRLVEALERALELSQGLVTWVYGEKEFLYSTLRACADCQIALPELEPRLFSFNDPQGACQECGGLGYLHQFTEEKSFDFKKSLEEGALRTTTERGNILYTYVTKEALLQVAESLKIPTNKPWGKIPAAKRKLFFHGNSQTEVRARHVFRRTPLLLNQAAKGSWPGIVSILLFVSRFASSVFDRFRTSTSCPACKGKKLGPIALAVRFRGMGIDTLSEMTVEEALAFFSKLELSGQELELGKGILREISGRLLFLESVGVGYLGLSRRSTTLSGGESQRIRLAAQLGGGLQGVLYVLDEPSIGLHPRDNTKLIQSMHQLRDRGNTLFVVEHDQDTMRNADEIVDLGPGAGEEGGRILAQGTPKQLMRSKTSVSGGYLSGAKAIPVPKKRRKAEKFITITGANKNNLKNLNITFPLGVFTVISGVSGSGKSTLVHDILQKNLIESLNGRPLLFDRVKKIEGLSHIDKVIEVDQSPIGRTPRSNPATYTKLFDVLRGLFSQVPEARARGYKPGRFSFNVPGGRCENCKGAGVRTIEMQFLSNVEVVCEECSGHRFHSDTLEIAYKGLNVSQVLSLPVSEALVHFQAVPQAARILETLKDVGLGYLRLGQPATTLSGGEAQRMKLASELRLRSTGKTLYLLDEPTTGLHPKDIHHLLTCLNRLVEGGNTVLVIEHNLDFDEICRLPA